MPYIGNTIRAADDYRLIDDISSGFNGSETSFALQVAGSAPVPFPKSPQQVLISVNGVIQEPDPSGSSGFNLVGTNIVFSSAPTNGHAFFGIIYATADYLNAGGNFPAGSLGAPSITFIGDENSGLYRKSGGSVGFVSDATEIANFDSNGITISSGSIIIPEKIIHSGDTNTFLTFPSNDAFRVQIGGAQRLDFDGSNTVFNDDGGDIDFRIEGNSVANLFKVDASVDNIGIGMASPRFSSGNGIELADNFFLGFGSGNGTRPDFQFGTTVGATLDIRCGTGADTVDLVINTSGHLGIGTTSPSRKLHVDSSFIRVSDGYGLDTGGSSERVTLDNGFISLTTNSNERLRLDSSGRLLLGTSTARAVGGESNPRLHLEGSGNTSNSWINLTRFQDGNGSPNIQFAKSRSNTPGTYTVVQDGDNLGQLSFLGSDGTDMANYAAIIKAQVDGTPGSNDMPGRLIFMTTADGGTFPTERMRIDSSGNVGIGASDPSAKLNVSGRSDLILTGSPAAHIGGSVYYFKIGQTGVSSSPIINAIGSQVAIPFQINGSEKMRIDQNGDVAIGTTAAGGNTLKVQLTDDNSDAFVVKGGSGQGRTNIAIDAGNTTSTASTSFRLRDSSGNTVASLFFMNNADDLIIGTQKQGGEVIFHTSTASNSLGSIYRAKFDQNGNFHLGGSSNSYSGKARFFSNNNGTATLSSINLSNSGTNRQIDFFHASATGRVGSIQTNSSETAFNTSSDYRLKENEVAISDGITRLKKLKPYRFNFKIDPTRTVDGFFAHEVTPAVPEAISGEKDAVDSNGDIEPQSIDQSKLVPLLTAALQEEIAKREALEARIAALEAA